MKSSILIFVQLIDFTALSFSFIFQFILTLNNILIFYKIKTMSIISIESN